MIEKEITKQLTYDEAFEKCKSKALTHNSYKFYADENKVLNILGEKGRDCGIYLSNGSKWNDVIDRSKFNSENSDNVNFGLCLSFSKTESIAMWMLYGGMEKKGMMIDFTNTPIKYIKNYSGEIQLGKFVDNRFDSITLYPGQYSIEVFDIVYKGINEYSETYYRSDESFTTTEDLEPIGKHNIVKTYGWKYENEVRVVVTINKKHISNDFDTVYIPLKRELIHNNRIYYSPSFQGEIRDCFNTDNYYAGKIDWDLCKNCKKIESLEKKLKQIKQVDRL